MLTFLLSYPLYTLCPVEI